jgi:hypothetical protein
MNKKEILRNAGLNPEMIVYCPHDECCYSNSIIEWDIENTFSDILIIFCPICSTPWYDSLKDDEKLKHIRETFSNDRIEKNTVLTCIDCMSDTPAKFWETCFGENGNYAICPGCGCFHSINTIPDGLPDDTPVLKFKKLVLCSEEIINGIRVFSTIRNYDDFVSCVVILDDGYMEKKIMAFPTDSMEQAIEEINLMVEMKLLSW